MTQLFIGTQEIMLLLFSAIIPLGLTALVLYIAYRLVDRWVNRSIEVRREQNALLAKLLEKLEEGKTP
ncbi:hypothetical protein [Parapedobacter sp. 10938]|uniref:hypothetical protein n=1 Tax=Parapedobacter flavus TaxID=3110225 RepID=UPI002DB8A6C1|nr:hypothetical protein [Parapedobacter sp. 10938]MEC3880086.1 hypothetical protein [Parapedobacter sp. 10938]